MFRGDGHWATRLALSPWQVLPVWTSSSNPIGETPGKLYDIIIYIHYIYIYIIYIHYIYYYIILYITTYIYIYILYMGNLGSYFGVIRKSTTCSTTTVVAQCLPPICLFAWMASNFACKLFSACHNLWRYSWMVYSGKTYFFNMDDVGDPYFRKPPFCWRRLHQAISKASISFPLNFLIESWLNTSTTAIRSRVW